MSDEATLDTVVKRFVSAEQALIDLRAQQAHLLEATSRFNATDDELRDRTGSALAALEDARTRLREQMEASATITKGTGDLHQSLTKAAKEVGLVLQTLRQIDPAAMSRDLGELRRATADNAAEVRELRRLVAEVQRNHDTLVTTHAALVATHADTARRIRLLLPVGMATLLISLTAVVIAIAR
jgi:hypothetical protein